MSARGDMLRAASAYHSALAAYTRAFRFGGEVEDLAQRVVGAALEYRRTLERLIAEEPAYSHCGRRAEAARKSFTACRQSTISPSGT